LFLWVTGVTSRPEIQGPDKPGRTSVNIGVEGIRVTDLTGLTADRHVAACSQQGKRQNSKQFLHRFPHFQSKVEVSQRQRGGCHEQVCGLSILHHDSFIETRIPDITPTNIQRYSSITAWHEFSISEAQIRAA
jgi:hypothetical protein